MELPLVDISFFAEDGRLKYKVSFEEKGKSLVSGHHIAFDHPPKLKQLYVGARVVVRCQDNKFRFRPGILAELPSRKNRLRWVFKGGTTIPNEWNVYDTFIFKNSFIRMLW